MKLRKIVKRSFVLLCAMFMILQTSTTSIFAEKGGNDSNYTYTITLYSGKEGTFSDGSTEIKISDVEYGSVVSLADYLSSVSLKDSEKYYVRGIRESGKDNNTVSNPAFKVESDREYVVAYGIKGDMTSYVVNYVDSDGNALAPSQTYYGVIGDQAVVAFHYVDGYRPQAYNLSKTLSKNEADNVLTFTYSKISLPTASVDEQTETSSSSSNNTSTNRRTNNNSTRNNRTSTNDSDSSSTETDSQDSNSTSDEDTPEEIVDLDEDETPLSSADSKEKKAKERPAGYMYAMIGMSIVAIIGLIALLILLKKKRKNKK